VPYGPMGETDPPGLVCPACRWWPCQTGRNCLEVVDMFDGQVIYPYSGGNGGFSPATRGTLNGKLVG
jgi:hypothetical protein